MRQFRHVSLRPAELLQHLIRFDTTNPPGNEAAIVAYMDDLLTGAGIETTIRALDPNRPNLIARLKGRGTAPPLLMQAHVDVVTTANQEWQHDPFGGELIDGYIWGRGALDMKNTVAMYIAALLRIKGGRHEPAGDIILAIVSDEENGGDYGAKFLVENHPELFEGVRYSSARPGDLPSTWVGKSLSHPGGREAEMRYEGYYPGPGRAWLDPHQAMARWRNWDAY